LPRPSLRISSQSGKKLKFSVLGICWVGTFLARTRATQNGDRLLLLSLPGLQNLQRPSAAAHFALVIVRRKRRRAMQSAAIIPNDPRIDAPDGGR
jgi:hypothetical protein